MAELKGGYRPLREAYNADAMELQAVQGRLARLPSEILANKASIESARKTLESDIGEYELRLPAFEKLVAQAQGYAKASTYTGGEQSAKQLEVHYNDIILRMLDQAANNGLLSPGIRQDVAYVQNNITKDNVAQGMAWLARKLESRRDEQLGFLKARF